MRSILLLASCAVATVAYSQTAPIPAGAQQPSIVVQPPALPALNQLAVNPDAPALIAGASPVAVKPNVEFNALSDATVFDVHLRPLYETAISLPSAVSTVAVGAPTLFEAEHKDSEPNLVFVKPSTHAPAQSNLLIALANGQTVSMRLISPGDGGSADPVDFVVHYHPTRSFFASEASPVVVSTPGPALAQGGLTTPADPASDVTSAESAIGKQDVVGAPHWMTASDLTKLIKENAKAPNSIALAIGEVYQSGETMTVSFSVLNISNHWVTIMPRRRSS